jgi:hypothetical protein
VPKKSKEQLAAEAAAAERKRAFLAQVMQERAAHVAGACRVPLQVQRAVKQAVEQVVHDEERRHRQHRVADSCLL